MQRQRIPNDNSCLFTAIGYCINGDFEPNIAEKYRKICVEHILKHSDKYSELYLGKKVEDYCEWLLMDTSWGGEIEILLLAELLEVKISVVQMETLSILSYEPPSTSFHYQIYLIYTGQHYDALVGSAPERLTRFDVDESNNEDAIACARLHKAAWEENLRTRLRKRIKCLGCEAILNNIAAFQQHCSEVEHDDEFCYDCEEVEVKEIVDSPEDD